MSVNLKIGLVVLVTLGVYTLVANMIPQVQSEVPQELSFEGNVTPEQLVTAGEQLYQGSGGCTACHGLGTRAPNLLTDEAGTGDHVVAPLADRSEVDAILTELKWRPFPPQPARNRVSRADIWISGIAVAPFLLILGLNLFVFAATPLLVDESMRASVAALVLPGVLVVAVPFALLLLAVAARWLDWRRTGYLIDGDRLLIRRGWWTRRIVILPVSKVQSVEHRESAVSRWFGTATLLFGVAGGSILATPTIPALPRETARKLREELLSRGP